MASIAMQGRMLTGTRDSSRVLTALRLGVTLELEALRFLPLPPGLGAGLCCQPAEWQPEEQLLMTGSSSGASQALL
jgi:hypothetical protein